MLIPTYDYALRLAKQFAPGFQDHEKLAKLMFDEQLALLPAKAKLLGKDYHPDQAKGLFKVDIF